MRPIVKICGITNYEDASIAVRLGADILGFVFAPSPRRIGPEAARAIVDRLSAEARARGTARASTVGVFVNESPEAMAEVMARAGLDLAQIHGDERPADCARLPFPWYRALRIASEDEAEGLAGGDGSSWGCSRLLFDASAPGAYGGTGRRIGLEAAAAAGRAAKALGKEFFLAGGLGPGNVAEAIEAIGPDGVDVGSGVEEAPGKKSRAKLEALFREIEEARGTTDKRGRDERSTR